MSPLFLRPMTVEVLLRDVAELALRARTRELFVFVVVVLVRDLDGLAGPSRAAIASPRRRKLTLRHASSSPRSCRSRARGASAVAERAAAGLAVTAERALAPPGAGASSRAPGRSRSQPFAAREATSRPPCQSSFRAMVRFVPRPLVARTQAAASMPPLGSPRGAVGAKRREWCPLSSRESLSCSGVVLAIGRREGSRVVSPRASPSRRSGVALAIARRGVSGDAGGGREVGLPGWCLAHGRRSFFSRRTLIHVRGEARYAKDWPMDGCRAVKRKAASAALAVAAAAGCGSGADAGAAGGGGDAPPGPPEPDPSLPDGTSPS